MTDSSEAVSGLLNPALVNIYSRRSVRSFIDREVPDEIIQEIVKAGSFAPSAVNKQPWRFVVVKNKGIISKYEERARNDFVEMYRDSNDSDMAGLVQFMSKPNTDIFYGAPVLILVFSAPDAVGINDCSLAAENMMLAAWSLGIGSCWIGLARALGEDAGFLEEIGIPDGHKLVAPLIFGYPAKKVHRAPPRKDNLILNWIN